MIGYKNSYIFWKAIKKTVFYVSQNEHFIESINFKNKMPESKVKNNKRAVEKTAEKKPIKKKQMKMVNKIFFYNDNIN